MSNLAVLEAEGFDEMSKESGTPQTYEEMRQSPDRNKWIGAMREHVLQMKENNVYREVQREGDELQTKWEFFKKDGKYTARMKVVGPSDYEYSPVCKYSSVRLLLGASVISDLFVYRLHLRDAFFHTRLNTAVYVDAPEGCEGVWELNKAVFGLRNASRLLYDSIKRALRGSSFKQSKIEECLFVGEECNVLVYADELLVCSKYDDSIDYLVSVFEHRGYAVDMEADPSKFLGMNIEYYENCINLSMRDAIEKMEKRYRILTAGAPSSPISTTEGILDRESPNLPRKMVKYYRSLLGTLAYIARTTRSDVICAVRELSRYTSSPTFNHLEQLNRAAQYLVKTKSRAIVMEPADFDYAMHVITTSTKDSTAYVLMVDWMDLDYGCGKMKSAASTVQMRTIMAVAAGMAAGLRFKAMILEMGMPCDSVAVGGNMKLTLDRPVPGLPPAVEAKHKWLRDLTRSSMYHVFPGEYRTNPARVLLNPSFPQAKADRIMEEESLRMEGM